MYTNNVDSNEYFAIATHFEIKIAKNLHFIVSFRVQKTKRNIEEIIIIVIHSRTNNAIKTFTIFSL